MFKFLIFIDAFLAFYIVKTFIEIKSLASGFLKSQEVKSK